MQNVVCKNSHGIPMYYVIELAKGVFTSGVLYMVFQDRRPRYRWRAEVYILHILLGK